MGNKESIYVAICDAIVALERQGALDDINEICKLLGDRVKYDGTGRVCVLQSLLALTREHALTPEEAKQRGAWRSTMQMVQACLAAIYRVRVLERDETLLLTEEASVIDAPNCQVHVVLLIELLNWFSMKKDTHATEVEMVREWLFKGCHRGFATRFGATLCNYIAAKTGEDYATIYADFVKHIRTKDDQKTHNDVQDDIEAAMRSEGRMVDVLIRMGNGGRAGDLASEFTDHRAAFIAACEKHVPEDYRSGAKDAPAADAPSHVETVEEARQVLGKFRNDLIESVVEAIVRRWTEANGDGDLYASHINHFNALVGAYNQMK